MDKALDNPYNTTSLEYKLSIPPSLVIEKVAQQTEKMSPVQRYIPFSARENIQFWSRFESDDIFRIYRKSSAKGYLNSFAPWLVGWVKPSKDGSSVKVFFEMDERVSSRMKYSFVLLIFFTVVIGWLFVRNIISGALMNESNIGVVFITIFWVFWYGIRKIGFNLGQQDKVVLRKFVEDLFAPYYVQ